MKALIELARPEIRAMTPYSSARREQQTGKIWLNANENPWADDELLNRYPDPQPQALLDCLSELYQVSSQQLLVCRGSDEAIDLLLRVFCRAGQDGIIICPPTYGMYKIAAQIQHASIVKVPLIKKQNFALDNQAILANWQPNLKLIFLCSPNNPTGNLLSKESILALCTSLQDRALIIVDEAYIEFAQTESISRYLQDYPNLVILRTLSKAYGLAGLRCGVVIAREEIINLLKQVLAPYPIPRPIIQTILDQLTMEKRTLIDKRVAEVIEQRNLLSKFLEKLPIVEQVWTSDANFILIKVKDAKRVMEYCLQHGIVLRDRSHELNLANCVRITVGTPKENQILMEVLSNA